MTFRDALLKAAVEEKIPIRDRLRLRLATLRPECLAQLQQVVVEEALLKGVLKPSQTANLDAFDFNELLDFIRSLLEMLIELLPLIIAIF